MFNFQPQDWLSDERFPCDASLHEPLGILPGVEGRFSKIKIANNINELGPDKDIRIDLDSKITKTFELVQAVRMRVAENVVREYITSPKGGSVR